MGKIRFDSEVLSEQIEQLKNMESELKNVAEEISKCSSELTWTISSSMVIHEKLYDYAEYTKKFEEKVNHLANALSETNQFYRSIENRLLGETGEAEQAKTDQLLESKKDTSGEKTPVEIFMEWIQNLFHKDQERKGYEIDSILFDDDGKYGANQGSPRLQYGKNRQDLDDIIRKYHPDWTEEQRTKYLTKLNSEGCAYAAFTNVILKKFEGKEAEFEKIFGFPMYKDGDLNYNDLIVDFYCATDNHNKNFWGKDKINNREDKSDEKGNGRTTAKEKYRTELYLNQKGIDINIQTNKKVTVDNYKELAEKGTIVINYRNGNLYDENGKLRQQIHGHAMVITGVTEDGRFIVSSWGEKLYIDPNESIWVDGKRTNYDFVYCED